MSLDTGRTPAWRPVVGLTLLVAAVQAFAASTSRDAAAIQTTGNEGAAVEDVAEESPVGLEELAAPHLRLFYPPNLDHLAPTVAVPS